MQAVQNGNTADLARDLIDCFRRLWVFLCKQTQQTRNPLPKGQDPVEWARENLADSMHKPVFSL